MKNRKKLRDNLTKLELNEDYLKRKRNLTELEKKLLYKMLFVDKEIQTDPMVFINHYLIYWFNWQSDEQEPARNENRVKPKIVYPTPLAMEKIERFLNRNKWRLIDLFKDLDKNKDWSLLKSDFKREYNKGRISINDSMLDELIAALGSTKSTMNYKSFSRGRLGHLSDKRNQLRGKQKLANYFSFSRQK
jgi:hypothetical protein